MQNGDRRAEVRFGIIPELCDEWVPVERGLNDSALNAPTAAVNEAHACVAGLYRGGHVLVHNRRDVSRLERVEVELGLDGHAKRLVFGHGDAARKGPEPAGL